MGDLCKTIGGGRLSVFTDEQSCDALYLADEQLMPRIPDELTYGICFTYRTRADAEANARHGGTAFLVGKPMEGFVAPTTGGPAYLIYAVTNYHVAWGGSPVLRIHRSDGVLHVIELSQSDWLPHPNGDDLAVAFLSDRLLLAGESPSKSEAATRFVTTKKLVTPQILATHQVGLGDDIFMIGRFLNLQGTKDRLAPAVRLGSISSMSQPVWNSVINKNQESFAVEMRSRTGFSGSPVAVFRSDRTVPVAADEYRGSPTERWWWLLGVNWGFINDKDTGENTWLNGVVPAWKILEVLEEPYLKDKHEAATKMLKDSISASIPTATPSVARPEPDGVPLADEIPPSDRERFNSLLNAAARKRELKD